MSDRIRDRERLEDLLADRAMYGLSVEEEREMERLLPDHPDLEPDSFERAAASLALAHVERDASVLPAELRAKLVGGAHVFFAARANVAARADETKGSAAESARSSAHKSPRVVEQPREPREQFAEHRDFGRKPGPDGRSGTAVTPSARGSNFGWWLAVAAAAVAVIGWWPRDEERTRSVTREGLLASADVLRVDAKGTELAANAGGDVVWSNQLQAGWMRIVDLPRNDPKVQQYQLWIFDAEQEHPIDGGVFDVDAAGEILVPIDAKLRVAKPTLFAITVEKPGGVVVSDRQRIAWVAAL